MRYMLMLYADESAGQRLPPEAMRGFMEQMFAYRAALIKAQAFVDTSPLMPASTARSVRVRDTGPQVVDGPYADTREQLGGYSIIEAGSLDDAQAWAVRCPAATWGTVEVRALREMPPQ